MAPTRPCRIAPGLGGGAGSRAESAAGGPTWSTAPISVYMFGISSMSLPRQPRSCPSQPRWVLMKVVLVWRRITLCSSSARAAPEARWLGSGRGDREPRSPGRERDGETETLSSHANGLSQDGGGAESIVAGTRVRAFRGTGLCLGNPGQRLANTRLCSRDACP